VGGSGGRLKQTTPCRGLQHSPVEPLPIGAAAEARSTAAANTNMALGKGDMPTCRHADRETINLGEGKSKLAAAAAASFSFSNFSETVMHTIKWFFF